MKKRRWLKRLVYVGLIVFVLMNVMAFFHAYRFTHFSEASAPKTANPEKLGFGQKISTLFFGIQNPRPENKSLPDRPYETVQLQSNRKIECWHIPVEEAKGTVILFHGFSGEKSSMLDKAAVFGSLGYHTFLVDFMGSGGSEGNQTTVGYLEGEQVRTAFEYIEKRNGGPIYLFGTSMGAAAIMKAMADAPIAAEGIILECPFGTLYGTVCARFHSMGAPTFPMAGLLTFWGGAQNGFWAFSHNPETYAKSIHCLTLLLYGGKDERVSRPEMESIFANLKGPKDFITYPEAGHENYLNKYRDAWTEDVKGFMRRDGK